MTNRQGLVRAVTARLGNKAIAVEAVAAVEQEIVSSLARGERVRLASLGTLQPEIVPSRMVRNPRTGEKIHAPTTARVRFRPSNSLKSAISGGSPEITEGNAPE